MMREVYPRAPILAYGDRARKERWMKIGWARAIVLAALAVAACSKSGTGDTGDAGPHGPTKLTAKWTFTGKPASASECEAHGASQVYVNLSATIEPSLHQTLTVECEKGTASFGSPLVEELGMPFLEASLLDDKGVTVATVSTNVNPEPGTTTVTLDFFPAMNTGGAGTTSSSAVSSSSSAVSSSSGGTGGTGGMPSTSSASGTGGAAASSSAGSGGAGGA
ncbi:Hypothetical protein A7982_12592 [Minicystis rosea]|nr:Hypothetical protein A7982_12592 [Minicystis rosea]